VNFFFQLFYSIVNQVSLILPLKPLLAVCILIYDNLPQNLCIDKYKNHFKLLKQSCLLKFFSMAH
jgi:hypothetical protein